MSTPFKAIIIGGGPVGLLMALCLKAANIDFVLLERRQHVVTDKGTDLVLYPMAMRVFSQLGMLDDFLRVSIPLSIVNRLDHNGNDLGAVEVFDIMKDNFGQVPRFLRRSALLTFLYDRLGEESHASILTNENVFSIEESADGVRAVCKDGEVYTADIVIGADGAHSVARDEMRRLALVSGAVGDDVNDEKPFLTRFLSFVITFPRGDLTPGISEETHGHGAGSQIFTDHEMALLGMYTMLDEPTRERIRTTEQDEKDIVDKWGHMPIARNTKHTLRTAWEARTMSTIVSLEEGVLRHWSWGGRVVLIGDAAHKFTPTNGSGCNHGMMDAVSLANKLNRAINSAAAIKPTTLFLSDAFQEYQKDRQKPVVSECRSAGNATAACVWINEKVRHVDLNIVPTKESQARAMALDAKWTRQAPSLDFLPADTVVVGKVPWKDSEIRSQL